MLNRLSNEVNPTRYNTGNQTPPNRPELLAPAGSFSAAYHAFCAGADAVYFGLKDFSARKGARNFTMEEVARLKGFAESNGKRIYAALNTVIREDELREVASVLYDLQALQVDGVIIQDLGVLYLLHRWFPALPIHASTQMAVHNAEGVETLKSLGVRRIILARELTLEELKKIRDSHPDVELEVFIHGALCYSVSGLCLASGILLGRSGNRGECAQICRSWFSTSPIPGRKEQITNRGVKQDSHVKQERRRSMGTHAGAPTPGAPTPEPPTAVTPLVEGSPESLEGYFFSCRDLALGENVLELCRIGIDAFKIEGRLKSPEWVAAVTRYYRTILDTDSTPHRYIEYRTHTPDPPQAQYPKSPKTQEAFERACWIFSRSLTEGYVSSIREWEPASAPPSSTGFPGILDPRFPGHRGVLIGTVEAAERNRFLIKPKRGLAVRDGLQFFRPLQGIRMESVPFGIERIWLADTRDTSGKISEKSPRREAMKRGIRRQTSHLGKPILSCRAGQPVWIETPKSVLPTPGTEIYLISTHADTLPEAPRNIPRKRIPLALSVALNPCSPDFHPGANPGSQQETGTVSGERSAQYAWLTITVHEGHADKTQGANPSPEAILTWGGTVPVEKARSGLSIQEVVETYLSPPGDSMFQLVHTTVTTETGEEPIGIFIPPSKLKEIRRKLYLKVATALAHKKESCIQQIVSLWDSESIATSTEPSTAEGVNFRGLESIPPRDQIYRSFSAIPFVTDPDFSSLNRFEPSAACPPQPEGCTGQPGGGGRIESPTTARSWVSPPPLSHGEDGNQEGLPVTSCSPVSESADGSAVVTSPILFLPLAPVLFQPEAYWTRLEDWIRIYLNKNPANRIYLGLNNVGHIPFTARFRTEERVRFFIDYGLYIANRLALRLLRDLVPRLDFYYPWVELVCGSKFSRPEGRGGNEKAPSPRSEETMPVANTGVPLSNTPVPAGPYGTFKPPLFISRACVYRSLPGGRGCSTCPYPLTLRQGNRTFVLTSTRVGGSCLNLLFSASP